jgi:hypothetical protein
VGQFYVGADSHMNKIHVIAKRDFIETLVASKPIAALSEVIWNGFDADSEEVEVFVELSELDGLVAFKVRDRGYLAPDQRRRTFWSVRLIRPARLPPTVGGRLQPEQISGSRTNLDKSDVVRKCALFGRARPPTSEAADASTSCQFRHMTHRCGRSR